MTKEQSFGMLTAIQTGLRAIVKSHPDPERLIREFEREHNETLAILGVHFSASDEVRAAYRDCLIGFAPNSDDWLRM